MKALPSRVLKDENFHRAFFATVSGELVHLAIDLVLAFFIALGMIPFWGISLGTVFAILLGVFAAHASIELHDRYDTTHQKRDLFIPVEPIDSWEASAG